MKTKPTKYPKPLEKEIKFQIEWLKSNKEHIPRKDIEENWETIDAVIDVLENNLSEKEIFNRSTKPNKMGKVWGGIERVSALQVRGWMVKTIFHHMKSGVCF